MCLQNLIKICQIWYWLYRHIRENIFVFVESIEWDYYYAKSALASGDNGLEDTKVNCRCVHLTVVCCVLCLVAMAVQFIFSVPLKKSIVLINNTWVNMNQIENRMYIFPLQGWKAFIFLLFFLFFVSLTAVTFLFSALTFKGIQL